MENPDSDGHKMTTTGKRWSHGEDDLFRHLAELHLDSCVIADILKRSVPELRRRGYVIGLPRKWFKPDRSAVQFSGVNGSAAAISSTAVMAADTMSCEDRTSRRL
jgi:hypothetical protein